MEIKSRISFDEFNAVVDKVTNDCFNNDDYLPTLFDLSFRTALLAAYAPEYELDDTDNNTLYESVYTDDAISIINEIKRKEQYRDIKTTIRNSINHRKAIIASGAMSLADVALANLFNNISEFLTKNVEQLDTESMKSFVDKIVNLNGELTAEKMAKALAEYGSNNN